MSVRKNQSIHVGSYFDSCVQDNCSVRVVFRLMDNDMFYMSGIVHIQGVSQTIYSGQIKDLINNNIQHESIGLIINFWNTKHSKILNKNEISEIKDIIDLFKEIQ